MVEYFQTSNIKLKKLSHQTIIPNIITVTYRMIRISRKLNPPSLDPGSNELYFVGSPNKYLRDPDFVINKDTKRVVAVDIVSNTGNDPKQT